MRLLGKSDDDELEEPEDVRLRIPEKLMYKIFPPYFDKSILPEAGGSLNQDDDIMEAINIMQYMISWCVQNEQKRDPDKMATLDDLDANPNFPTVHQRKQWLQSRNQ